RRRKPGRRIEIRRDALRDAEAMQSRRSENCRMDMSIVDLPDAGRDVAPQLDHVEIRSQRVQLRAPAQTRRADPAAGWKLGEGARAGNAVRDQNITWILARQQSDYLEARRHLGRQVLQRM